MIFVKKALIFQGGWDGHTPLETSLEYKKMLEPHGFEVTIVDNLEYLNDYENLLKLWKQRPDLHVEYAVPLGTERCSVQARRVLLETVTAEDIGRLAWLPNLKQVVCGGGVPDDVAQPVVGGGVLVRPLGSPFGRHGDRVDLDQAAAWPAARTATAAASIPSRWPVLWALWS